MQGDTKKKLKLLWENIGKFKKYKYVSILPLPVLNIISWMNVEIGIYMWILQGNIFKQAILEKLQIMLNNGHNWKFYINVKLATNITKWMFFKIAFLIMTVEIILFLLLLWGNILKVMILEK